MRDHPRATSLLHPAQQCRSARMRWAALDRSQRPVLRPGSGALLRRGDADGHTAYARGMLKGPPRRSGTGPPRVLRCSVRSLDDLRDATGADRAATLADGELE